MSVRVGRLNDLNAVMGLERSVAEAPHWAAEDYVRALGAGGPGEVKRGIFVWYEDGAVRGFAVGSVIAGGGEIESLVVGTAWRRLGVGRALCEAVIAWCNGEGAEAMRLEVRASSAGTIALYEGLGFCVTGRRRRYYGAPVEDAILMILALAEGGKARVDR